MARKIDGTALGEIFAGSLFFYAGLKGISVPHALQAIVQGKNPQTVKPTQTISTEVPTGPPGGPVTGLGNVPVPSSSSQKAWASAQLVAVGALPTSANIDSLAAWANRESPWNASPPDGAEYTHNPLNTTDQTGAVGEVNSVNVAIYPDWATGIAATAATLAGYPDILARLRSGQGLCGWSSPELSTWSGGGYSSIC